VVALVGMLAVADVPPSPIPSSTTCSSRQSPLPQKSLQLSGLSAVRVRLHRCIVPFGRGKERCSVTDCSNVYWHCPSSPKTRTSASELGRLLRKASR
jgi:hypothetical protein